MVLVAIGLFLGKKEKRRKGGYNFQQPLACLLQVKGQGSRPGLDPLVGPLSKHPHYSPNNDGRLEVSKAKVGYRSVMLLL